MSGGTWVGALLISLATGVGATASIDVCFSPDGKCEERIIREIEGAKTGVLIQAYGFTSRPIADALVAAEKRGISVRAILDASNAKERYSAAGVLRKGGVEVVLDGSHPVANNKVIIVDEAVVLTGSMNFTKAADDANAENLLVIQDAALAEKFTANWKKHFEHAEPMKGTPAGVTAKGSGKAKPPAGDPKPGTGAATMVVVTENGKRYHRANCETVKGGGVEMTVEEARKNGKTACKKCKPDG